MGCRVFRDPETNKIKRVLAPNGEPSQLYLKLFTLNKGDKELALEQWADAHLEYNNKLNEQGEPDVDVNIYRNVKSQDLQPSQSADPEIESASKSLPTEMQAIVDNSKGWKVDETDINKYSKGDAKVTRVGANDGPVNNLRATPFTMEPQERAEKAAEKKWGKLDPKTPIEIDNKKFTQEQYIEHLKKEYEMIAAKGSIAHKYLQFFLTPNTEARLNTIRDELRDLLAKARLSEKAFSWLTKGEIHKKILTKAGINIYNRYIPKADRHKLASEVVVVDDKYLEIGGTLDLLIYDPVTGNYSVRDFKSGSMFNKEKTSAMFKYGVQNNLSIMQTPRNTAKLQVMFYAMLLKINNPDIKFDNLEITWVPSRKGAMMLDSKKRVEVEDFLGMIRQYLENEQPAKLEKLREGLGQENFNKLFDPNEYEQDYENNTKAAVKESNLKAQLELKLQQLKEATMYDLRSFDRKYQERKTKVVTVEEAEAGVQVDNSSAYIRKLFKEVLKLHNDLGIKTEEAGRDISTLSLLLTSNPQQNSPYIQLFDKILRAQKLKAIKRYEDIKSKEKPKLDAVQQIYWDVHGKPFTDNIPLLKGAFSNINYEKMWGWMYVDKLDEKGNKIGRKIRTTEAEWKALKDENIYSDEQLKILKDYADFHLDVYDSFFIGKDALANKTATYRFRWSKETGMKERTPITNLELHNEYRKKAKSSGFVYERGWFPKTPTTLEEFGYIWNKEYRQELWRRHVTLHHEVEHELEFNELEVIPLKYLGSDYLNTSENYSINAEMNFDKFVRNALLKEELEQVYAYGKGVQYYLAAKGNTDETGAHEFENTISYLKTALESQVRGRRQLKFQGGFLERAGSVIRTGDGGRVYLFNWIKFMRTLMQSISAPIMWLKPLAGTANGIFTYMFTLKEAIKNDLIRQGKVGNFLGIDGDEVGFGVKDIAKATGMWLDLQKDAMFGKIKNNKMFRIAKMLGYMPQSTRYNEYSSYVTARNKIFDNSTMYMFHKVPEEAVSLITMTAQMMSMKTRDGKSVWDHYREVKETDELGNETVKYEWDGFVRYRKRLPDGTLQDLKELDENEIRSLYFVYERMHGGYREDERARLEYFVVGQLFMQFKRYLPNILKQGFGSKRRQYSYGMYKPIETYKDYKKQELAIAASAAPKAEKEAQIVEWHGRIQEGKWKVMLGLTAAALPLMSPTNKTKDPNNLLQRILGKSGLYQHESYNWKNLDPWQRETVADFVVTMTMLGLMYGGYMLMFANADDDNALKKYYNRIMMNFGQHWNVYELLRELVSANAWPAAGRQTWNWVSATTELAVASSLYATGFHEEALTQRGDLRGWNNFRRHTRGFSSYYELEKVWEGYQDGDMDNLFDFRLRR